ncbi:LysR family transcriptional regulator [Cobetia amphilecti]|uniref:LysR family transcriptional regulator n=1 Tax=Cobetia amphilecti TaxID=1055104 RepID=UPI0005013339|nr:LysR family transcriptional regulator [Cobetia amphilecti]KGA01256.1 LysR family transcriptional regulator [Cobetia amphilecti]
MAKLERLDIKQLRVFQALLREQNASRAAGQLGLTQQAVSEQLKKLRDIFDDRLFLRKTHGLVPTPLAQSLAPKVDEILLELQRLLTPQKFDPAAVQSTFVISATDYAQQIVLPALLAELRREAPGLKIVVRDFEIDTLHALMESNHVNLAIAFPDYLPESYPSRHLFSDRHVCMTSKHSSIADQSVTLADIARHPNIIASPSRPNLKGSLDDWFKAQGLARNIAISAPCFSVVPAYLEATDSVAFLPARAITGGELVALTLEALPEPFDVTAAWHPRYNDDPLHQWVVSQLMDVTG